MGSSVVIMVYCRQLLGYVDWMTSGKHPLNEAQAVVRHELSHHAQTCSYVQIMRNCAFALMETKRELQTNKTQQ